MIPENGNEEVKNFSPGPSNVEASGADLGSSRAVVPWIDGLAWCCYTRASIVTYSDKLPIS